MDIQSAESVLALRCVDRAAARSREAVVIHVWTGQTFHGLFPTVPAAIAACQRATNDHRRKVEVLSLVCGGVRYVGPRGRRHGTRMVAYIGTRDQLQMLGILVDELDANLKAVRR